MAKKKMGRPLRGGGRPFKLDVRLWEVVHNRLEELVKAGDGKVSKADIVNYAILNFSFEDLQAHVALEAAERAMHDYEAEFESDD